MPIRLAAVFVLKGEDLQHAVLGQGGAQVTDPAVEPGGTGRTEKTHGDFPAESLHGGVFHHLPHISAF